MKSIRTYTPQTTKRLYLRYRIQFKTNMIRYTKNTDVIIVLYTFSFIVIL